jgi:hypothetical protein
MVLQVYKMQLEAQTLAVYATELFTIFINLFENMRKLNTNRKI